MAPLVCPGVVVFLSFTDIRDFNSFMRFWCCIVLCGVISVCNNDRINQETDKKETSAGQTLAVATQIRLDPVEYTELESTAPSTGSSPLGRPCTPKEDQVYRKKDGKRTLEMPNLQKAEQVQYGFLRAMWLSLGTVLGSDLRTFG